MLGIAVPFPSLPSAPIPPFVSSFFAFFPLITYAPPHSPSSTPAQATLWLLGPPESPSTESLDPFSRQAQTLARFLDVVVDIRWLSSAAGAPGQKLPAMHLPNGELLGDREVVSWLVKPWFSLSPVAEKSPAVLTTPAEEAFSSLVRTTLLPAVLAALYLSPTSSSHPLAPVIVPRKHLPILSSYAKSWTEVGEKRERISEVFKLRGKRNGIRQVLDLEEGEVDAVDTIGVLEEILNQEEKPQWFAGAS